MSQAPIATEFLGPEAWERLRNVRLAALQGSPAAFLSTYEEQARWSADLWRAEVRRGRWLVAVDGGRDVALLGATPESDVPGTDRYLSYMWVAPDRRGLGLGRRLVNTMLRTLHDDGVPRAWLWVMGDNDWVRVLYEQLGFRATGDRQPLKKDPSRHEVRMARNL